MIVSPDKQGKAQVSGVDTALIYGRKKLFHLIRTKRLLRC